MVGGICNIVPDSDLEPLADMSTTEESPNARRSSLLKSAGGDAPTETVLPLQIAAAGDADRTGPARLLEPEPVPGQGLTSRVAPSQNGHGTAMSVQGSEPLRLPLGNGAAGPRTSNGMRDLQQDRVWMPRAAEPFARQQLSEFVELSHRLRVPSLADQLVIGEGEWISTTMIRATAVVICDSIYPGVTGRGHLIDLLMRGLVQPTTHQDVEDSDLVLPVITTDGRIFFDLSTSPNSGVYPEFRLIRVDDRPELWLPPEGAESYEPDGVDDYSGDQVAAIAPTRDLGAQPGKVMGAWPTKAATYELPRECAGPPEVAGTGALIWGSAAAIARGRSFLDADFIVSYAQRKSFGSVYDGDPNSTGLAVLAAKNLEIVVMLDPAMSSAFWIDVDPATGEPAAVLVIDLKGLASVTHAGVWAPLSLHSSAILAKRERERRHNGANAVPSSMAPPGPDFDDDDDDADSQPTTNGIS
jgi:hypothetical protein